MAFTLQKAVLLQTIAAGRSKHRQKKAFLHYLTVALQTLSRQHQMYHHRNSKVSDIIFKLQNTCHGSFSSKKQFLMFLEFSMNAVSKLMNFISNMYLYHTSNRLLHNAMPPLFRGSFCIFKDLQLVDFGRYTILFPAMFADMTMKVWAIHA